MFLLAKTTVHFQLDTGETRKDRSDEFSGTFADKHCEVWLADSCMHSQPYAWDNMASSCWVSSGGSLGNSRRAS